MKKDRLTPRADRKKTNRSLSPQNVANKGKAKNFFPTSRGSAKENQQSNSNEHSLQICLDLASYHKKEAEMLKQKNQFLQQRLKEEVKEMQNLHSELKSIKAYLNSNGSRKDLEALKTENTQLKSEKKSMEEQIVNLNKQIEQLSQQNIQLRNKPQQTESLLIESPSKCQNSDIKSLTLAKQSRRQEYANRYQYFSFVPSTACLQCGRKDNQLEEARNKYSNELRDLQEQVNLLQRNQIALQVMEKQMISKNQCIDYLLFELRALENDSSSILKNMTFLEGKLQELTDENAFLRMQRPNRLDHSCSNTVT